MNVTNHLNKKEKKIKVRVIPTEIYSRVVGYYRPLQNWNNGKNEEFSFRRLLDFQEQIEKDLYWK